MNRLFTRTSTEAAALTSVRQQRERDMDRCDLLRSLQRPGSPLVLPNVWDVATAKAVVAAGFPVVATTSAGVAAALGYDDHEQAPPREMLDAAARICRGVDVPVTVDAEAGYDMPAADLVAALIEMGAAGCNLEDTDHATRSQRDPAQNAARLRAVRQAAVEQNYPLVINARIDVFLPGVLSGSDQPQTELVAEAVHRARAYVEAGADCVFPIALWQREALVAFLAEAPGPVNAVPIPRPGALGIAELAELGVARVSYAFFLHRAAMEQFSKTLASLV
jgi:2-methylisocitrate lyase-like PEP mutase family enzyme